MLNYEYPPLGGGQGNANKYIFEEFNKNYTDLQILEVIAYYFFLDL